MKSVFLIAIVAAAIIGVMFTPVSVYAETIEGENIGRNGIICITDPISTPQQDNRISVSLNAYAVNYDVNVIIQIDGKTKKNQDLPMQSWTPVSGTFTMSEKNSHTLGICLWKSAAGTDTRTLEFNDVNWSTSKVSSPPVPQQQPPQQPPQQPQQQPPQQQQQQQQQQIVGTSSAKAAQDLTDFLILGGIVIVIILLVIVLVKRKNIKSNTSPSPPVSPPPSPPVSPPPSPPPSTPPTDGASTIFFYECPKCQSGDIQNNSDGSVNCPDCGYRG